MSSPRQMVARLATCAIAASVLAFGATGGPALADTAPHSNLPVTASNDVLPTPQIDGVVWDQTIADGIVFAGGKFKVARPDGALPGQKTTPRMNLLSYDLKTGKLTKFAPKVNGEIKTVTASPDGQTVYIGGQFTHVDGKKRTRLAAFDVASGKLLPDFAPKLNFRVNSVAISGDSIYVGGAFSASGKHIRKGLAAFHRKTGALLKWAPTVTGGQVRGVAISPDAKKVVAVGLFDKINGEEVSGWGAVDAISGKSVEWQGKNWLKASGKRKGFYSVSSDAHRVYVTAFSDGEDNFEGVAAANWSNGSMSWVLDCHGDSYDTFPDGKTLYWISHAHSCESVNHKPETEPWTYMRANAVTTEPSPFGLKNQGGQFPEKPAPEILHWYPKIDVGTATGTNQGAWTVEAADGYVVIGGEFRHVNGKKQQGLARFAVGKKAPLKSGPIAPAGGVPVKMTAEGTKVTATVKTVWDRDNEVLKYVLVRNGEIVAEKTAKSIWFRHTAVTLVDPAMPDTGKHAYVVAVVDPNGNYITSKVTLLGDGPLVRPGKPDQIGKPFDPNNPQRPVGPGQPADPNQPGKPAQPVDPGQPGNPGNPDQPGKPAQPVNPGKPDNPTQPVDPDQPANPGKPAQPVDPDQPGKPDKPGGQQPVDPGRPGGGSPGGDVDPGVVQPRPSGSWLDQMFRPVTDFFNGLMGRKDGPDRLFGPGGFFF